MSDLTLPQESECVEFRVKFTHASTAIGSIYFGKEKLMDFITNLNSMVPEGTYPFYFFDSLESYRKIVLIVVAGFSNVKVRPAKWSHELHYSFAVGSLENWQNFPRKTYSRLFAESDSSKYLDSLIDFLSKSQVSRIKVTHSECIRVYLTGRG